MSSFLWTLDPAGDKISASSLGSPATQKALGEYFPNRDIHKTASSLYRAAATNIYRTKDDRFFHLHSTSPRLSLLSFGIRESYLYKAP